MISELSPQRFRFVTKALAFFLAMVVISATEISHAQDGWEPIPLKVRFWADEIELTGAVPDKTTAFRLREATHQAHPGKPIWDRLVIDPGRTVLDLPDGQELAGLLLELALSTHDGSLQVTPHEVVVSGLTDSLVTHAAFEARLRPLAARYGGRHLRNRICIVHEDDLDPAFHPRRPRPALNPRALSFAPVELAETPYGPPLAPLRATPLVSLNINAQADLAATDETSLDSPLSENAVAEDASTKTVAPPEPKFSMPALGFTPLEDIKFSANSYLVGSEQFQRVDSAAAHIQALPEAAGKIILRGHPDNVGRHIYNDWLTLSRLKAIRQVFVSAGIPEERMIFETQANPSDKKLLGSVRIFVPRQIEPDPFARQDSAPSLPDSPPAAEPTISVSLPPAIEAAAGAAVFSSPSSPAELTPR